MAYIRNSIIIGNSNILLTQSVVVHQGPCPKFFRKKYLHRPGYVSQQPGFDKKTVIKAEAY